MKISANTGLAVTVVACLFLMSGGALAGDNERYEPMQKLGKFGRRMTKMSFYFHDIVVGQNRSVVRVADAGNQGFPNVFGSVMVMDDPLTEGPEIESQLVGSASGMYVSSGLNNMRLLMAMTIVFENNSKYSGSTLSMLSSNAVPNNPREMAIVGGTGKFRFASGYVVANTHSLDASTGNAVVRYDVVVLH